MLWSIPIAVIAGTVVRVHITFLLFLVWIAGTHWRLGGQTAALDGVIFILLLFACVVAHEFGHIVQYKNGLSKRLQAGQPTVKRVELHADFLAGYFAGARKLAKPDFPAAVYATTQYGFGDYRSDSVRHHGRPEERAAAIVRGFEVAFRDRGSPAEALAIGMRYVATM